MADGQDIHVIEGVRFGDGSRDIVVNVDGDCAAWAVTDSDRLERECDASITDLALRLARAERAFDALSGSLRRDVLAVYEKQLPGHVRPKCHP